LALSEKEIDLPHLMTRWAMVGAMLLTVAGCAASSSSASMTEVQARNLISRILSDIENIYLRETNTSEVVTAGLDQVQATYPDAKFIRQDDEIVASVGEEMAFSFKVGDDHGATDYWGDRIAATLEQVQRVQAGDGGLTLKKLTDSFVQGVAEGLDYPAAYLPPEKVQRNRTPPAKGNGMLDLVLSQEPGGWLIERVRSPALRESGLIRKGDLLLAIDGTPLKGASAIDMLLLLHGELGSPVELTVSRADLDRPLTIRLQREAPPKTAVENHPEGSAFLVGVTWIDPRTLKNLRQAVTEKATAPNAAFSGIILDLRGTVGGYLDSVVDLADTFLEDGPIFSTHGRHKESEQHFSATQKAPFPLPVVVLVDRYTGAGGEIAAAALQDSGHAVIVGSTSFGKGTIRTALPLPNRGVMNLPWTEVITASGYRLDKRGVMPTVCTGGDVTAEAVIAALRSGAGVIDRATRTRDINPEDTAAVEAFRALCSPREDGADLSLEVARAILADPDLFSQVLAAASR
jgi:carboxyl-terminal processing protease